MKYELGKRTISRNRWMDLINEWTGAVTSGPRSLTHNEFWTNILKNEGGYGATKIKTVQEAILSPRTWPGVWFRSKQTNYNLYTSVDYVASLLFGRQISRGSIDLFARDLLNRRGEWRGKAVAKATKSTKHRLGIQVVDWGGTAFTAIDIIDLLEGLGFWVHVTLVNYNGPQLEFADWAIEELGYDDRINVLSENEYNATLGEIKVNDVYMYSVLIMSEVLEHIQNPDDYLYKLVFDSTIDDIYLANSFCTPAYGHHIPILIGGKEYYTPRTANKAFKIFVEDQMEMDLVTVEGYNSRLKHLEPR